MPVRQSKAEPRPVVVAGIGTSAGGLEALEKFLGQVPEECGLAFVIVQHLDPSRKGVMPEILQRATAMKVLLVRDRMRVEPDCVYVIPSDKDMSILHGVLHLFEPEVQRGLRLPIDFFFCSLAKDQQQMAIGVILTGMGSDGTLGLRAIKEQSGLVVVEDPTSAKFDSMPRSAIAAGLADIIGPVEELPSKILAYLQHVPSRAVPESILIKKEQGALEKVILILRDKTGNDFSCYRKNTFYRRVEHRMALHKISRIDDYVRFLQKNSQEIDVLFKEIMIGVTQFFRDSDEWDLLRDKAIPELLTRYPKGGTIRVWSVGCSTGEEAYTLAMVFEEALAQIKPKSNYTLQVFATDLDQEAIDMARQGFYPLNIAAQVSDERLQRFFIQEENGYRVSNELRERINFASQNLVMDPPFIRMDILLCRNLLIYLESELQKKLLPLFHFSIKSGGLLFLGSSETVGSFTTLFKALHPKSRLFWRQETALRPEFPNLMTPAHPKVKMEAQMPYQPTNLHAVTDQLLLQHFSPAAVLTTDKGDILYISGRTGKYLEPAAGKVNWNLFAMARDELRFELTNAFHKAVRNQKSVTVKGLKVGVNSGIQSLDLTIQPDNLPEALRGMVIVIFKDVEAARETKSPGRATPETASKARLVDLERELKLCREELQRSRDELQSSQEELSSMHEEMQSTNEELRSVNDEQTSQMQQLKRTRNDMENLLNSTEIITLFLDGELRIRGFTPGASEIFNVLRSDVGRPLTDLSSELHYPEWANDARSVLQTLLFCEKQVPASNDRWFTVRTMPYRTTDNRIEGVVMTFSEISTAKRLEAELRYTGGMLKALVKATPLIIVGLSASGEILEFNPEAERLLESRRDDVLGGNFFELFLSEADQAEAKLKLREMMTLEQAKSFTTKVVTGSKKSSSIQWTAEKIHSAEDQVMTGMMAIGQMTG